MVLMSGRLMSATLVLLSVAGCMNCPKYITQPTITSSTGATLCARHRIPLITVNGWAESSEARAKIYDSVYMQLLVETCNPNSIPPWRSLHRSARYDVRAKVSYCPLCEKAVQANLASPNPTRVPSWWDEFRTGVHINKN